MFKDFVTLFTEMSAVPSLMLCVGLILSIIKIFQPGQTAFGYLGGTFLVLGVVFRMVNGGNSSHLFWLTFLCFTILITSYMISVATNRSGWFAKMKEADSIMAQNEQAYYNNSYDISSLINSTCISATDLKPLGTIKINKKYYVACTNGEYIASKNKVLITKVENNKIYVKKIKGD